MVVYGFIVLGCLWAAIIGELLIDRGRQGDPSNGRPSCPNCWYDMRGSLPSVVCPECGHDAELEGNLYLARKRPGLIALGVVLMVSAALLFLVSVLVLPALRK